MGSIYKKNLEALRNYNPLFHTIQPLLRECQVGEQVILQDGVLKFQHEGQYYQLVSRDKDREAELLLRDLDPCQEYLIVLFGMANTSLLRKILKKASANTMVLVFEPNLAVMKYILKTENLVDIVESCRFGFIAGGESEVRSSVAAYTGGNWENLAQNLSVISLPNYYLYQDYRVKCTKLVASEIKSHMYRLGNSLEDMLDGLQNYYQNIDSIIGANSLSEIKGKFKGYPAIVVASGPSLDKNIQYLKEAQDKALIISCDASYATCVSHGVRPDAIASIERYSPTYEFFYKGRTFPEDLVLVGPCLLWPELMETFPGKKLLMAKSPVGMEGWWCNLMPKLEFLDMGHSCATAAYALAREAGCSPIILIGQDLAYTDDKYHTDSIHRQFDDGNEVTTDKLSDALMVEGIDGKPVRTSETFNLFRCFFEENIALTGTDVVDATEGGAKIAGTRIMTFQEAISQYCTDSLPFHMNNILEKIHISKKELTERYDEVIDAARRIMKSLKEVQERIVKHYEVLMKYQEFDFENADAFRLSQVLTDMQGADQLLTYLAEEKPELSSYYNQLLKQTAISVRKIGNHLTPETVRKNWEIQVHLMKMMDVTAVVTSQRFLNLIQFVEAKKTEHMEE